MDATYEGASAWSSVARIGRVDRVERVERSSRVESTSPARHFGREYGELPRPDISSLHAGDIQWFESLVLDARSYGLPSCPDAVAGATSKAAQGLSRFDSPAERIAHCLAHLRTVRGL